MPNIPLEYLGLTSERDSAIYMYRVRGRILHVCEGRNVIAAVRENVNGGPVIAVWNVPFITDIHEIADGLLGDSELSALQIDLGSRIQGIVLQSWEYAVRGGKVMYGFLGEMLEGHPLVKQPLRQVGQGSPYRVLPHHVSSEVPWKSTVLLEYPQ